MTAGTEPMTQPTLAPKTMNGAINADDSVACANARIVILDDEVLNSSELEAFLRSLGYSHVSRLGKQQDMIVALRDECPDLVLLELSLRRPNAFELLADMHADRFLRHIPVIAITATDDRSNRLKALKLGARDYLVKPIDPADLELRVRNTLLAKVWHDWLTNTDELTGLPNRESSLQRLDWALKFSQRQKTQGALMQVGIERFKQIIGALGPSVGDELLRAVGTRLAGCVREIDSVGSDAAAATSAQLTRGDGDEFTLLLPILSRVDQASVVAQRVVEALAVPVCVLGHEIFVSCTIGIATFGGDGDDSSDRDTVLRQAKLAMRSARAAGNPGQIASTSSGGESGSGFRFFSQGLNQRASGRMALERELHYALERQELVLHYQPKVDLRSSRICGAEALVRWQHPQRGLLGPDRFIEMAEECGLIVPLGDWVLQEALRQISSWRAAGLPAVNIAVNVSSFQLSRRNFVDTVQEALSCASLDGTILTLELTESAIIETGGDVTKMLQAIRGQGVRLALDDFGTGYSSLSYLRHFPIDELKVDRSFIKECEAGVGSAALITQAIITMAHGLGLRVVAEGVETNEQLEFLRANACDQYQGYLFSKPVSASQFRSLLGINRCEGQTGRGADRVDAGTVAPL